MQNATTRLPATMTLGSVHLTVSDLARSLSYYNDAIGLDTLEAGSGRASLGVAGTELLVVVEEAGARPSPGSAGLFHFALRVPTRASLARWLDHAARDRVPLSGMSDHLVSEAIYLDDPDGHGIEIYADRPREAWSGDAAPRIATLPLDTGSLMRELTNGDEGFDGMPQGTAMGHVHLRVGDIPEAIGFYESVLGLDLMMVIPQAAFLSVGGYHHHIGVNTWQSRGGTAATAGFVRLLHATLVLPDRESVDEAGARVEAAGYEAESQADGVRVRDPFGTALLLTAAS